jgi:hypothetical protein
MNYPRKNPTKQAAHGWLDYLRESNGLGGILAKTENLAKLRARLLIALEILSLGHLSSKIEAGWRSGTQDEIFLIVSSASVGSRLQQVLPSLINELSKNGVRCKGIKVHIRPNTQSWEVKPKPDPLKHGEHKGLNGVAKKSWQDLMEKLAPDSDLRKAVERLLKNQP